MSTEMLGTYNIAISVFAVISTIICSGLSITITRFVPINYYSNNKSKNNSLIFSSLVITTFLGITACVLIIVGKDLLTNILSSYQSYILLVCMIPAILSNAIYTPFKSYMLGRELYLQSSLVELIEQILRIVICYIVYVFFKDLESVYSPVIAMGLAGILSTLIGLYYYKKNGGGLTITKPKFKTLIKKSTPITLVKLLSTLVVPLITIILPLRLIASGYSNSEALSMLGIATGMTLPLLSIPGTIIGSLATALIPQISTLYENNENLIINKQVQSSLRFTIITTFLLIPIFIELGEPICEIVFDNKEAGILLAKSSWIMIPMGVGQITTTILNSMGYEKSTFVYYIVGSIFMTICIYLLPQYVGIESIIWAMGTSNIIVSLLNIIKLNKTLYSKNHLFQTILYSAIICIPVCYLIRYIYNIMSYILPMIINLGVTSCISVIVLFALYLAFGIIDINIIKTKLKELKLKKTPSKKFEV